MRMQSSKKLRGLALIKYSEASKSIILSVSDHDAVILSEVEDFVEQSPTCLIWADETGGGCSLLANFVV